jgi:c-di-GMP-binding flagellar brake protein YcgR
MKADLEMKERRKEPRKKEENKIIIRLNQGSKTSGGKNEVHALTQDISSGGVRVLTDRHLSAGDHLELELLLSKTKQILRLSGEVKWVHSVFEGELYEVGIEFLNVEPGQRMLLLKHIYGDVF